jgi:hypothetical protein
MNRIRRGIVCHCLCAMVFAATASVTPAFAQGGNIRSVTFYKVKPDRVSDFIAEIKAYNALLAKGGSTHYNSTWSSLTGSHEYAHVIYYKNWADLDYNTTADPQLKDEAADLTRIGMRIVDCAESYRRTIEEIMPEFSSPPNGEMPKMVRVLQTQVRPEKMGEYLDLVKNEIVPAIKKGGAKDYNYAQGRLGESSLTVTSVIGFNSWADLDETIGAEKGLGKEGYGNLVATVRALIVESQFDIYRFEPDLSYLAPPAK